MLAQCSKKVLHRNVCTSYLHHLQALRLSSSSALQEASPVKQGAIHPRPANRRPEELTRLFPSTRPRPLTIPLNTKVRHAEHEFTGLAKFGLYLLGYFNPKSKRFRKARVLHIRLALHVSNPALYSTFNLERSFRTTHAMLVLHLWLLLARMKTETPDGYDFNQCLYIIYNEELEKLVVAAGVKMLFSKTMTELEKIFYGSVQAYDKAIMPEASKDDLARTLWRNVFAEDDSVMPTGKQAIPVQMLAQYVRREIACLALTDKESLFSGNILFSTDGLWHRVIADTKSLESK